MNRVNLRVVFKRSAGARMSTKLRSTHNSSRGIIEDTVDVFQGGATAAIKFNLILSWVAGIITNTLIST